MKKSKKIPKTYLPKYAWGTVTPQDQQSSYSPEVLPWNRTNDSGMGPNGQADAYKAPSNTDGGSSTFNMYNEKRTKGLTNDQYTAAGTALVAGAANTANVYGNSNAGYTDKYNSASQSATGVVSAISPVWGAATQATNMIAKPIKNELERTENGRKVSYVAGHIFDPLAAFSADAGMGSFGFKGYEKDYRKQHPEQFPNGGMNMTANAEIENQENVVAPNGGFLQANGPSHENGGVPVALPGNSMIFSDRLKVPGTKKTFADLNKVNNTNKEDKLLESDKLGNISKHTAELMKYAKNKNSEALFNAQEALKQAKVQAYAKKMGVTLPQPTQEVSQEQFAMGGVQLPMYTEKQNELPQFGGGGRYIRGRWVADEVKPNFTQPDSSYQYGQPRFLANGQLDMTGGVGRPMSNINLPYQPMNSGISSEEQYNQDLAKANARVASGSEGNSNKFNWGQAAMQAGNFAAQNAGNIYDLIGRNKTEVEKYDRLKATYLDPTAAMRDAEHEARLAEYGVRNASGGNAGTYLSARTALNAQNVINKDRIRQQYANVNAGIGNQIGQYNNELSRAEVIANAQNRAVNDNIKRQAIGSLGSNYGQFSQDSKSSKMDQSVADMLPKMINDPQFAKFYEEWLKKNK